jgi:hypothetical protein
MARELQVTIPDLPVGTPDAVVRVVPGSSYGDNLGQYFIGNNSGYDLVAAIWIAKPPPKPPRCLVDITTRYDDGTYLSCDLLAEHEGPHCSDVDGTSVFWNDKESDVGGTD